MTASESFHAGRLAEATQLQIDKVRSHPTDRAARLFLFELFLFAGDLDRAAKQVDVLNYDNPEQLAAIAQYRLALEAERKRREVFAGKAEPTTLAELPQHALLRLQSLKADGRGETEVAAELLREAAAVTPSLAAVWNDEQVTGLMDADVRLGTVLEVFGTGGVYCWVPLEQVASISLGKVTAPRDILLRPAALELHDGTRGDILLPGLAIHSHLTGDEELMLGRASDTTEAGRPAGVKLWLHDAGTCDFVQWSFFQNTTHDES